MSWRNQGITGSNNIPLGKSRRFGGEPDDGPVSSRENGNDDFVGLSNGDRDLKRGRSPEPRKSFGSWVSAYPSRLGALPGFRLHADPSRQ